MKKSNKEKLISIQVTRKNYDLIKKYRALFIMRNSLSRPWDRLINDCVRKCRIYCNQTGCTAITIEFKSACKVFKNKMGKCSYYAELYDVIIAED